MPKPAPNQHVTVSFTCTRKAITTRLQEYCDANGITYDVTTTDRGKGPQLVVTINGVELPNLGDAAEHVLAGGSLDDLPKVIARVEVGVAAGWRVLTVEGSNSQIRCTTRELAHRVDAGTWKLSDRAVADVNEIAREILRYNQPHSATEQQHAHEEFDRNWDWDR
jgi:hypothetical protein